MIAPQQRCRGTGWVACRCEWVRATGAIYSDYGELCLARDVGDVRERIPYGTLVRSFGIGGGPDPSADLFCQLDDDSLGAADVAEPVAVLVAHQLADELSAAGL